jgi:hypothetical protein
VELWSGAMEFVTSGIHHDAGGAGGLATRDLE